MNFIRYFFAPLVFGFGFIAPLVAQIISALGITGGVSSLVIGLIVGGLWGLIAQLRGSWVWVKP